MKFGPIFLTLCTLTMIAQTRGPFAKQEHELPPPTRELEERARALGLPARVAPQTSAAAPREEIDDETWRAYLSFVQYLLDIRFTDAQRRTVREHVESHLRSENTRGTDRFRKSVAVWKKVKGLSATEREAIRRGAWLDCWTEIEADVRAGDAEAKYLKNLYLAAHPPLAGGDPPLFREWADALIEFEHFWGTQILQQKRTPIDAATRRAMHASAAADWAKFSGDRRREIGRKVQTLMVQRAVWKRLDARERLTMRAQLAGETSLTARERMQLSQFQQQLGQTMRSHQLSLMQNELNGIRANQQLIMGSAPQWNPTTQRYERIGGINTEYR